MMEQMDLFSITPTEPWVYQVLMPTLQSVITHNNISLSKLVLKEGKAYSSVWYDTQMAFRICCRDNHTYFGVSNAYAYCAPPDIGRYITKEGRSDGFTNYSYVPTEEGICIFSEFLAAVLDQAIDSIQKEFDCCSRFEECSDAKHCTNPNADLATGCGYRKIMKKGRIYYGANRNID